jgi:hypothetical protein
MKFYLKVCVCLLFLRNYARLLSNASNEFVGKVAQYGVVSSNHGQSILLIAAVPKDAIHVAALWSELECLTTHMDRVIIAAPHVSWSKLIMGRVLLQARRLLTEVPPIDVYYFDNSRYDAGLWCDAIGQIQNVTNTDTRLNPEIFFLVNDSVFILRKFDGLREEMLRNRNLELLSMNGSGKNTNRFWVER